ncbi:tetratricopeptide repeat protein [Streptomyces sp. NPDC003631]|nr:tetratricopeptide repeat protein [Streptomyces sp. WAC07094]
MKRLWTGVGAAVAVAAGTATWAIMSQPAKAPEAKSDDAPRTALKADALMQAGLLQVQYQDFDGAKATFERVLKLDPHNKLAWYNMGVVAEREGRRADALKAYDSALKADSSFTSALFNKALLLKKSDPDRALELLQRAVSVNPKASTAYFQIGETMAIKGLDKKAQDAYQHAVDLDPSLRSQVPKPFKDSVEAGSESTETSGR